MGGPRLGAQCMKWKSILNLVTKVLSCEIKPKKSGEDPLSRNASSVGILAAAEEQQFAS